MTTSCHWRARSGRSYRSRRWAQHKLAARLEGLKARMVPGGKALEAYTAIGDEADPGGSALEACLAIGEEVIALVAHSMVSKNDGDRYLHLQMLLIGCALEPKTQLLGSAWHMSPKWWQECNFQPVICMFAPVYHPLPPFCALVWCGWVSAA